jgi:hypothetical protein
MSRSFKNSLCSRVATKKYTFLTFLTITLLSRSFKDSLHLNSEKCSYLIITQLLYQRLVLIFNSLCSHVATNISSGSLKVYGYSAIAPKSGARSVQHRLNVSFSELSQNSQFSNLFKVRGRRQIHFVNRSRRGRNLN